MTSVSPEFEDISRLEGRRYADRYELTRLLDSGGFGAVYEASDSKFPGRRVAVKLGMAVTSERAFSREAMLIGQMNHENVVKVYDHGVEGGLPYIVMEMLHGDRLDLLVKKHQGRLPRHLFIQFIREICAALHNLHVKHLVHRDLKPKNIMLVDSGSVDEHGETVRRFMLLDFGIASKFDATNSLANRTMDRAGTPEYMSPEQISGHETTPRTDIYSFGVILYELLSGSVPFPLQANTPGALAVVITGIAHSDPPRFSEIAPDADVDPDLEQLVRQCLSKSPDDRPETIIEVRNRLLGILEPPSNPAATSPTGWTSGRTLTPGGTLMPGGPAFESSQETATSQSGETGKSVPPPRTVVPLLGLVALICIGLGAIGAMFLIPWGLLDPDVPVEVSAPETLRLVAGESGTFTVSVSGPAETPVELELLQIPEGVRVSLPDQTTDRLAEFRVTADLNLPPGNLDLVLLATAGELQRELRVKLEVTEPVVWIPRHSRFNVTHEGSIVSIEGRNYWEVLVYHVNRPSVGGGDRQSEDELPLRFLLIDPTSPQVSRRQEPFYVMENKVWSGLFAKFLGDASIAGNTEASPSDNRSRSGHIPAFGMTVNEAMQFAEWLGGAEAKLPSVVQWWTAAGYFDVERSAEFQRGPFRETGGELEAADFVKQVHPVGSSQRDVSPRGCRDMAMNGLEWTSNSFPSHASLSFPVEDEFLLVYLVGNPLNSDEYDERLTYQQAETYFSAEPQVHVGRAGEAIPDCGFRLVIQPAREMKN
jgi:serine/threonine protein kinase